MPSTVKLHLDKLRCITESDTNNRSEPYLWVTYFWLDGRNISQPNPISTMTPVYNAFRSEFADNVTEGTVIPVPTFVGNASFEVDPGPLGFMLAGAVVVLWEEDDTPQSAMIAGRNAYLTAIHKALNDLIRQRIGDANQGPIAPAEIKAIVDAVKPAVESAIRSSLSFLDGFKNQDDQLGFGHVAFMGSEIQTRDFTFPELGSGSNRFVLNGSMTVAPTRPVFDRCAASRAAVQAQRNQIKGLQLFRASLQQQLQTAPPQAKPALIAQIQALAVEIAREEAELPPLEAALSACEHRFDHVLDLDLNRNLLG